MASSEDDSDYVDYGTPLEPLEEDEVPSKKRLQDLTVRDEKGRQRFHGAFTGGFSAGYFNTVGTKEGWAPSTFHSSRSKKADASLQRPEDFMDEEDIGQFGIAPRQLRVQDNFKDYSEIQRKRKEHPSITEGPIPGSPPLKDLFRSSNQSIGVTLLSQMGWREGQGIGPRVKKKDKKQHEELQKKVYGCVPPPFSGNEEEEDDPYAVNFLFAPDDIPQTFFTPKTNYHGIGYSGLDRRSVLSAPMDIERPTTTRATIEKGKKKLRISGQAFGVGAFEEEDDDIYAKEDMSQYDFYAGQEPDPIKQGVPKPGFNKGTQNFMHTLERVLEGFHLAENPPAPKVYYPPPMLPPDFEPIHRPSRCPQTKTPQGQVEKQRKDLFKEEPEAFKGSIFDMISADDKARIEAAKSGLLPAPSTTEIEGNQENVSELSLGNLKPFAKNESRQKRFEQYLSLVQAGRQECFKAFQPASMTEWEQEKERKEFQRMAVLCQPDAGLGSRFVSSGQKDDNKIIEVPLDKQGSSMEKNDAAKMNLFGKLTHDEFEWHPDKLLCRRFNIPNPYPDSEIVGVPNIKVDKYGLFNFLPTLEEKEMTKNNRDQTPDLPTSGENLFSKLFSDDKKSQQKLQKTQTPEQDQFMQENKKEPDSKDEEDEPHRPPVDFFKAIFSESSDSDDSDDEPDKSQHAQDIQENTIVKNSSDSSSQLLNFRDNDETMNTSTQRSSKPATGVFANIDFDELNKRPPPAPLDVEIDVDKPSSSGASEEKVQQSRQVIAEDEMYGPKLPPPGSVVPVVSTPLSARTPDLLILKDLSGHSSRHKLKSKHKSKKSKHKKHKSKSKHHKKHSKKHAVKGRPSDDSESDSVDDDSDCNDTPLNQEIIKKLKALRDRTAI